MERAVVDPIEQRIQTFLHEKFPLAKKAGVLRDTALLERGILDSLGILDVLGFLEGEFSITVSDEELSPENFQSLSALGAFVRRKSGAQ